MTGATPWFSITFPDLGLTSTVAYYLFLNEKNKNSYNKKGVEIEMIKLAFSCILQILLLKNKGDKKR